MASSSDITALTAALEWALAREELRGFLLNTFAPLTTTVGELRAGGQRLGHLPPTVKLMSLDAL